MSAIKERILGAITVMSEEDAQKIWLIIQNNFSQNPWDSIEEVAPLPDELAIIDKLQNGDEDYQPYMTHSELLSHLNLK